MPIIHKIRLLHKDIYTIGQKLPKRDKLGIHSTIEQQSISLFALITQAAFMPGKKKLDTLEDARIHGELLKNLIRTEHDLDVIKEKTYLYLSAQLIEISKMLNGWISYLSKTQKEPS